MSKEDEGTEKEAVGTQNDARLERLSQIADSAEKSREDEMPVSDDESEEEESADSTPSPDGEEREELADDDDETTPQVDEKKEPRKFKLKVLGRDVEMTEDELIAKAQKVEAADLYLSEASKAYRASQAPKQPETNVGEDDVALARAIQMGSEEEAVNAIRKLKSGPSFQPDDLTRIVDERLTFQDAANRFREKFPDLLSDPKLTQLVLDADANLVKSGDTRSYWDRYEAIGTDVRKWKEGLVGPKLSEKLARKATVTPIRAASGRSVDSSDQEPDDNPASVIAQMAKARGQRA